MTRETAKRANERMNKEHCAGAIKAAEVITGDRYEPRPGSFGYGVKFPTNNGPKTTKGIADLIEIESGLRELFEAARQVIWKASHNSGTGPVKIDRTDATMIMLAKAADRVSGCQDLVDAMGREAVAAD